MRVRYQCLSRHYIIIPLGTGRRNSTDKTVFDRGQELGPRSQWDNYVVTGETSRYT